MWYQPYLHSVYQQQQRHLLADHTADDLARAGVCC